MKNHGIDMRGKILVERLSTLPSWSASDEGRIVYVESDDSLYYGTSSGWSSPLALIATDSGTVVVTSKLITIAGGEGIDTSGSGTTVTIAGENASTSNKGIASFNTDDFSVSSGAVTIKDSGIDHTGVTNRGTKTHEEIDTHIGNSTAHGIEGSVVGTTDTQNLSNKTLVNPSINNITTFTSEYDVGNSGTSKTVNWNNGQKQKITLTGNCTLTFTAPTMGGAGHFQLKVIQDGTGSRTITWPGSIKWTDRVAPVLSTAASYEDIVSLYYDGSVWYGSYLSNFGVVA